MNQNIANLCRLAGGVSALAMLTAGVAATPAAAQDTAPTVGEVVVTAQFREQNLQQTPLAITAVNAAMLDNRSQTNIYQVAGQAPNVTLKPAGAAFGSALVGYIRGVGQLDFNFALEPGVGMYVDDVYYATLTGSVVDLLDLDRVEVLRGPQGTLAGKNSIGGAIKLYSKKPTGSGDGYLEATYGSLNRIDARGSADFALVPDKLFMRLSAVTRHHDGYVDRIDYACSHPGSGLPSYAVGNGCKLGTEGGQSFDAIRVALRWVPNDKVEVNLIGDATSDKSEVQASTITFANNPNPAVALNGVPYDSRFVPTDRYVSYSTFTDPGGAFANPFGPGTIVKTAYSIPPINTLKEYGVSGTVDVQLAENLSLKSISAYRNFSGDFAEDTDGSPLMLELVQNHVTHNQITQELRLNGATAGDKLDYTLGGFYLRSSSRNSNRVDIPYVPGVGVFFDFLGNDPVLAHSKSAFIHGVFHVTDKFEIAAGTRYSKEDKTYTFSRTNPDGTPNIILGGLNGVTGNYSGHYWDYRVDADYRFTPDVMGYLQFSTGTKGGGINPRPFTPAQVGPFGPEQLKAYEAGFKTQLLDHRMRLNVAAFFNNYNDIQLTLLACPTAPCAKPFNAGTAHVKGLEAETEIHPVGGLSIDGSVSYLDFKYTKLDPGVSGPTGVQIGMVTPYTPKWKWSAGIQYEIPMASGSLTPRLDAAYQSNVYTNAVNGPANEISSYTVANGRVTWKSGNGDWQTSLEVTNLFDKYYKLTVFDLSSIGAGFTNAQPGQPREWAVTVKRTF